MKFEAYRGVMTECPANTMPAYLSAFEQGYDSIYVDVLVTNDGALVAHHDAERICPMSYVRLLREDFGILFSEKFEHTYLCILEEPLAFAKRKGMGVRVTQSWQKLDEEAETAFFALVRKYADVTTVCCDSVDVLKKAAQAAPEAAFAYNGPVNEEVLSGLVQILPKEKLTVWLPQLDAAMVALVQKYAQVGIENLTRYEQLDEAETLGVDVISSPGQVKPVMNKGVLADMHTHSENSHDAFTPVIKIARMAVEKGIGVMAVTDHYDGFMFTKNPDFDAYSNQVAAYEDAMAANEELGGAIKVLAGIELGESCWFPEQTKKTLDLVPYDVVIGATHAMRDHLSEGKLNLKQAFSQFDWPSFSREEIESFFWRYFEEVLYTAQTMNIDILAHLGCPRGYIMRKCGWLMQYHDYEGIIRKILKTIIDRGIALEVQTSYLGVEGYESTNPDPWILEMYRDMGGYLITLSTDTHDSKRVGINFPECCEILKKLGFRNIFYLEKRRFRQCSL